MASRRYKTLNSNLILLIRFRWVLQVDTLYSSLNYNLILLIRKGTIKLPGDEIVFKFQSDSINTERTWVNFSAYLTLNSNLILLIRVKMWNIPNEDEYL